MIIALLSIIAAFVTIMFFISWFIHKSMTTNSCGDWDYGTFSEFSKEFNKVKWKKENKYPSSFFERDKFFHEEGGSAIHASIVRFNGHGMVLHLISYPRFLLFIYKNRADNRRQKGLWV